MTPVAEPVRAPHATSRLAERTGRRYLFYCLVVPVLGLLFPFFAERVPPFDRQAVTFGGSILDHGHGLAGQNADVVFFGDSTVMYGTDAALLSRLLGLKVINLPNTYGSLANTGDWALRDYLAGNKPPRLIVFQTSPWNIDFHQMPNPAPYEGDEQVVRHASLREFVKFSWEHPDEIFLFPFRFYMTPIPLTSPFDPPKYHLAEVRQGFSPNLLTRQTQPGCIFPPFEVAQRATGSVQELLAKYRTPATRTIAYLSPIPACQNVALIAGRQYPGFPAAPPVIVPPEYIAEDGTNAHPVAIWAHATTEIVARVVRQALEK